MRQFFKRFLAIIGLLTTTYSSNCQTPGSVDSLIAQGMRYRCGTTSDYIASLGVDQNSYNSNNNNNISSTLPNAFPSSAIITCGRFKIYYEDLVVGNGGFAEGGGLTGAIGIDRRSTLCAVLTDVQSVFDFSAMASNEYIRLHVEQSIAPTYNPGIEPFYARAGAGYYNNTSKITSGFVHDFVSTGTDPTNSANEYHARLQVNFDQIPHVLVGSVPVDYLDNYQNQFQLNECEVDLYSILLHEVGHILGWFSLVKYTPPTNDDWGQAMLSPVVQTANIFTGLDYSMYAKPNTNWVKLISGSLTLPSLNSSLTGNAQANNIWINNLNTPNNHPVFSGCDMHQDGWNIGNDIYQSYGSHLDEQLGSFSARCRISPGDRDDYVMGPFGQEGILKRVFTKGEIKAFQNLGNGNSGYGYNLTSTYSTNNSTVLANRKPYSTKMYSSGYNNYLTSRFFLEEVAADHTMQNTGATYTYNIAQDVSNVDLDGQTVKIFPGSLFCIRGCGVGNTHSQLTESLNGQTITFQPKADFIGRVQFGFNLYDGVEKGAFVLYTIDVTTGSNVTYAPGDNMIVNGGFEHGSEVKVLGDELIPNTVWQNELLEGKANMGAQFAEGHPYSIASNLWSNGGGGVVIGNSNLHCSNTSQIMYSVGYSACSFPGNTSNQIPDAQPGIGGNRFQYFFANNTFTFVTPIASFQNCKRYKVEYDIYSFLAPTTSVKFGFGSVGSITWPPSQGGYSPVLNTSFTSNASPGTGNWYHVTQYFWYCGNPSDMIFVQNLTSSGGIGGFDNKICLDNISIKEDVAPPPMTVSVSQSNPDPCTVLLTANVTEPRCSPTYVWKKDGVVIPGATASTYSTSAGATGVFTVTVTSCGSTATGEITLQSSCNQCGFFGTNNATEVGVNGGSISTSLGSNNYYITYNTAPINIVGTVNFTGSRIFMGPGVTINVGNGATLIIDNAHLFGCSQMWNGIVISGTGKVSVVNGSLFEDAITGIYTSGPTSTSGLIINTDGAVFNRNHNAIAIQGIQYPDNLFSFRNTIFTSRNFSSSPGYPINWPTIASLKASSFSSVYEPDLYLKNYPAIACKNGNGAFSGINLSQVGTNTGTYTNPIYKEIQIGVGSSGASNNFNIFDYMNNGIYAVGANFTAVNNVFMLMINLGSYGNGIYGTGQSQTGSGGNRARIYIPSGTDQPNKFYDCRNAVNFDNYKEVIGEKSFIVSSHVTGTASNAGKTGYKLNAAKYWRYKLTENRIYNVEEGIRINSDINSVTDGGALDVNTNNMGSNVPGNNETNRYMTKAVSIQSVVPCMTCPFIGDMNVNANTIQGVYNGIYIAGYAQNSNCNNNTIKLKAANTNTEQYGIKHMGCSNDKVTSNNVTGFGNSGTNGRAIFSESNSNYRANCNIVGNADRGFEFKLNTLPVQWLGNEMTNNHQSYVVQGAIGGQIGKFKPCLNKWLTSGNFSYSSANPQTVAVGTTSAASSVLWVNNNALQKPVYNISSPIGYEYVHNGNLGTIRVVAGQSAIQPCVTPIVKQKAVSAHAVALAMNQLDQSEFGTVGNWINQYNMWRSIVLDSSIYEEDSTGILQEFMLMGYDSRYMLLARVDSLFAVGDTAAAHTLIDSPVLLQPVWDSSANGVVIADDSTANRVVENQIKFYHIYLQYLDTLVTSEDSASLDSLASLCFMEDGNAVLQARTLYGILYDNGRIFTNPCGIEEDSSGSRGVAGQYGTEPGVKYYISGEHRYILVPNPNNGNFIIQQSAVDDGILAAEVWNAIGMRIARLNLDFNGGKAEIKLNGILSGTYLLKFNDKSGKPVVMKFTIL